MTIHRSLTNSGTSSKSVFIVYDLYDIYEQLIAGIWKSRWSCVPKDRLAVPDPFARLYD